MLVVFADEEVGVETDFGGRQSSGPGPTTIWSGVRPGKEPQEKNTNGLTPALLTILGLNVEEAGFAGGNCSLEVDSSVGPRRQRNPVCGALECNERSATRWLTVQLRIRR